jgi:hypothetical protein
MRYFFVFILFVFAGTGFKKPDSGETSRINSMVRIIPEYYDKAFPNPLKGFRSSSVEIEDYPTLTRLYIKWNDIEQTESDGVEKIVNFCNRQWQGLPERNIKVIPRVYLEWPYQKQNGNNSRDSVTADWGDTRFVERFWPADMKKGDYTSEQFRKRIVQLITKLGKAWDNDARVAYVEMGLIGWWGEQHTPYINMQMQQLIGDAFTRAFKTKLVMVRQAKDFVQYPFGSYWDSFAHTAQQNEAAMLVGQGNKWHISVRGGEVAYDWGDLSSTGAHPDSSLAVKSCRDYIIDYIRKTHCNHLGWINNYHGEMQAVAEGAAAVQMNLGYRFVLNEFSYTSSVLPGDSLAIQFAVTNTGSSPFYYKWPVECSLLDPVTRLPVYKKILEEVDIRTWLPGDKWNSDAKKYMAEPRKNSVTARCKLPDDIKKGQYIVSLAILDPAGSLPAVRFAIRNYFKGGRHALGNIGINTAVPTVKLNNKLFDDLYADRSLHYDYCADAAVNGKKL